MSDKSVEREIEANEQRKAENDAEVQDEGSVASSLGSAAASITSLVHGGLDDDGEDRDTQEERRVQNDAEQRPS